MVVWKVYFDHVAAHRDDPLMQIPSEGNRYAHKPGNIDDKDWVETVAAWKKLQQGGRRMSRRRKQRVRRSRRASSRIRR